jgi:LPS sulfotransferase NodH
VLLDLLDAERDVRPPRAVAPPARPYLVCSTPRSGSGLLCRGLAGTGVAGTPVEYFNALHRERLTARWDCGASLRAYVEALWTRRTTRDGVFGTKLHWDQLVALRAEALGLSGGEPGYGCSGAFLERLFPRAAYVRIVRGDVNRQAVSLWYALQTGTWSVALAGDAGARERAEVPYSYEGIERCRRLIEHGEVHWDRFLRANGIEPLVVVYEELAAAHAATIAGVLDHVAPEAARSAVAPALTTRRLSDDRTEAFLRRLAEDRERHGAAAP